MKQTRRQREIEALAKYLVECDPKITQAEIARSIGIDPARLCRLRKAGRVVVDIPETSRLRALQIAARESNPIDGTRPGVTA